MKRLQRFLKFSFETVTKVKNLTQGYTNWLVNPPNDVIFIRVSQIRMSQFPV